MRRSAHILLEGTPEAIDREDIRGDLLSIPGVAEVHHIHVWSLTSGRPLATLHLRLEEGAPLAAVLHSAKERLRQRFGIAHSTIEIDPGPDG